MDGTGSGQREMQSPPVSTPCRSTGCVFYAHHLFDGMCSKCYKDLKEQMEKSAMGSAATSSSSSHNNSINSTVQSTPSLCEVDQSCSSSSLIEEDISPISAVPSIVKKDVSSPNTSCAKSDIDLTDSVDSLSSSQKEKTKKKRCSTCKKRVGLTGFDCRCGGHYCSVHRYSDMHSCAFNYHELAQSEIRKQNPVVAAEKIKKI